jgi:leader peptidase (prepilin peptidase) / N-methyltransferase
MFSPDPLVVWIATLALSVCLAGVAAYDQATFRIPDGLNILIAACGVATCIALQAPLLAHALAALIGYGAFAAFGAGYLRLRGVDGLGLGDAKLLGAGESGCRLRSHLAQAWRWLAWR